MSETLKNGVIDNNALPRRGSGTGLWAYCVWFITNDFFFPSAPERFPDSSCDFAVRARERSSDRRIGSIRTQRGLQKVIVIVDVTV